MACRLAGPRLRQASSETIRCPVWFQAKEWEEDRVMTSSEIKIFFMVQQSYSVLL